MIFIVFGLPFVMATVDVDVSVYDGFPEPEAPKPDPQAPADDPLGHFEASRDRFILSAIAFGDDLFGDGDFKTGSKPVIELYKQGEVLEKFSRDELKLLDRQAMHFS